MRPIIKTTLCALVAAAVAAPALAASSNYYLKLGDIKGELAARSGPGKQLEIESLVVGRGQHREVRRRGRRASR